MMAKSEHTLHKKASRDKKGSQLFFIPTKGIEWCEDTLMAMSKSTAHKKGLPRNGEAGIY